MVQAPEWEWRQEIVEEFDTIEAREIHGVYAVGELVGLIALRDPDEFDDPEDGPAYQFYLVMTAEREGFNGYEHLDGFATLEEAKAFGDAMREEIVTMIRQDQED